MAITLVQTAIGTGSGTGPTTATFANPTQPGSLIVVFAAENSTTGDTMGSSSDDARNTYTSAAFINSNGRLQIEYARNADSAENISVNFAGTSAVKCVIAREYSGLYGGTGAQDAAGTANSASGSSLSATTSAATKETGELVVCAGVIVAASTTLSVGAGYGNFLSSDFGGTVAAFAVEDLTSGAVGTQTGTMSATVAGPFAIAVATFKAYPSGSLGNLIKPLESTGLRVGSASN